MNLKNKTIGIIGLGYVGLPLAVEFSKKYKVVGFDLDKTRIKELEDNYDRTRELTTEELSDRGKLKLSSDKNILRGVDIYIVTVPTPINKNNKPDLRPLKKASRLVGEYIRPKGIVVYESTVYPGCTEEVCIPIIETKSKMILNKDFFCGYSPERINPGDRSRNLTNIVKVTSGSSTSSAKHIDKLYKSNNFGGHFSCFIYQSR